MTTKESQMTEPPRKHRAKLVGSPTGADLRTQLERVIHAHEHVHSEGLEHAREARAAKEREHRRRLAAEKAP
jgi:hypothetical protein